MHVQHQRQANLFHVRQIQHGSQISTIREAAEQNFHHNKKLPITANLTARYKAAITLRFAETPRKRSCNGLILVHCGILVESRSLPSRMGATSI